MHAKSQTMQRQVGAVLLTSLIILMILTIVGLSSMRTNIIEERMASNFQRGHEIFQVAEAIGRDVSKDKSNTGYNPKYAENTPYSKSLPTEFGEFSGDIMYEITFRQATPPNRGSGWGNEYAAYHFNVSTQVTSENGSLSKIHNGVYQIGPSL
ncbi:MAG: pilus assembly PilX family protein [Candidatus Eutrophobiaceae bacterium]